MARRVQFNVNTSLSTIEIIDYDDAIAPEISPAARYRGGFGGWTQLGIDQLGYDDPLCQIRLEHESGAIVGFFKYEVIKTLNIDGTDFAFNIGSFAEFFDAAAVYLFTQNSGVLLRKTDTFSCIIGEASWVEYEILGANSIQAAFVITLSSLNASVEIQGSMDGTEWYTLATTGNVVNGHYQLSASTFRGDPMPRKARMYIKDNGTGIAQCDYSIIAIR